MIKSGIIDPVLVTKSALKNAVSVVSTIISADCVISNMRTMKAINRYIIVDKIKTEPKKVAGLIMTDDTDVDNSYLKAKIISCGNLVEGLKDGDVIYYDKHAGHDISWKDTLYRVIRDGDVVLVD